MPVTTANLTTAVEEYFSDLRRIRASGGATSEKSFYPALTNLLNAVGSSLRPQVFCVGELADQGAGHPDFGLYTRRQVQKGKPSKGQIPERGVVEVKPAGDDAWLDGGQPPGEPLLEPLQARAGHQHPGLRAGGRGRPKQPREAGDLPTCGV